MSKEKVKVGVVSFKMTFPNITNKLQKALPVDFEYLKIKAWLNILNTHSAYVHKWNNPTNKGLVATCKPLNSKDEYFKHAKEIKKYADEVNKQLGTGFEIDIKEG